MNKRVFAIICMIPFLASACIVADGDILFHEVARKSPVIYSVNPDGKGLTEVVKNGLYPKWSPDGKMFAYISPIKIGRRKKSTWAVHIGDLKGRTVDVVQPKVDDSLSDIKIASPCLYAWSPDGKKLAIASLMLRHLYVEVFDLDRKKVSALFKAKFDDEDEARLWTSIAWVDTQKMILTHGSPETKEGRIKLLAFDGSPVSYGDLRIVSESTRLFKTETGYLAVTPSREKTEFAVYSDQLELADIFFLEGHYSSATPSKNGKILLSGRMNYGHMPLYQLNLSTRELARIDLDKGLMVFSPVLSAAGDKFIAIYTKYDAGEEIGLLVYDLLTHKWSILRKLPVGSVSMMAQSLLPQRKNYSWR